MPKTKGKNKGKKHHLPRKTYMDIMQGLGGEHDPVSTYQQAGPRQRKGFRRKAKARGKTLQGLLSGGPVALQEKSKFGVRRQAKRTIAAAYKPAEHDVNLRQMQAVSLNQKQQADEASYAQWEMAEQAKMRADAATADQAFRNQLTANAIQENSAWQEAQAGAAAANPASGADAQGARDYTERQVGLARQTGQGASAARRNQALDNADEGVTRQRALGEATLTNASNRRTDVTDKFHRQLRDIAADRKDISLRRAADEEKEVARLHDQQVDIGQANRDWKATKRTLGIKEFEAQADAADDVAKNKLASKKLRQDAKIKRLERKLKRDDLTRKERNDAQAHLDRVLAEQGKDRRAKLSNKNEGGKVTPAQKKVWGGIEETVAKGHVLQQKGKTGGKGHGARGIAASLRRHGATPLQAKAAAELIKYGHVRKETARAIRAGGGYVPKSARG